MFWKNSQSSPPTLGPKEWQAEWHRILDTDPIALAEGPTPDPIPDIGSDFRIHFCFWMVSPQTRARLLAILPEAEALAARVEFVVSSSANPMSPSQAEALVREGLTRLQHFKVNQPAPDVEIRHMSRATHEYPKDMMATDSVTVDLDDQLPGPNSRDALKADAYFFLRETFYRANSFYCTANWLAWPLCPWPDAPDVYQPFSQVAHAGYSVGWHGDCHVILFDIKKARAT